MHYYKKHIGDYSTKAGKLSILQHGVYNLLIDSCYDREKFPTLPEAIDWVWASSNEEIEAVEFVLKKFFTLKDGVYLQNRIDKEISKFHKNAATNKRIAVERETKRRENSTNRERTVNEPPPNHKPLTINHKPLTKDQKNNSDLSPERVPKLKVPFKKIIELYHDKLPTLPRLEKLTKSREGYIRQRWIEDLPDMEHWENYFDYISKSDFLMGKTESYNDRPPFKANLEWITKPSNFAKIAEEKYHAEV